MVQTGFIVFFCAVINTMTHAFLDMNTRELYNLHNWRDFCSIEVLPRHGKSSNVTGTQALDQFCSNAFQGWQNLGEVEAGLLERCPSARDPKCRPWKGRNKCTVRIKAPKETEKTVELTYCAEGLDWDAIMIEGGHPHPGGRGTGSEIE